MRHVAACLFLSLAIASPVAAQQKEPISPFVVDLRGAYGRHKAEPTVAADLGVTATNLPTRTFGLAGGAHLYPIRRKVSLGIGANVVFVRGSRAIDITVEGSEQPVQGPTVRRNFITLSPEISLNFGHRNGWSYISGGMLGRSKLYVDRKDAPATTTTYRSTINYGGGARWFTTNHVAFSVDFRWYSVDEQPAAAGVIAQPRTTLLILSGGISFK